MTHVPVPESGGGSGSSTATFGEGLGQIFAMPATHQDTSAADDSGVDVVDPPPRRPKRSEPGNNSSGSRSPVRTPHRHGVSPLPRSTRSLGASSLPRSSRSPGHSSGNEQRRSPEFRGRSPFDQGEANSRGSCPDVASGQASAFPGPPAGQRTSPSCAPTVLDSLYSPTIAGSVFRTPSPYSPTVVGSVLRAPSHMGNSPSLTPTVVRTPYAATWVNSPAQMRNVGTLSFEPSRPSQRGREFMDSTSGSMKRGSDQGSLPSPSLVRPRTESAPPFREPLSHYPEEGAFQRSPNSVMPHSIPFWRCQDSREGKQE